MIVSNFYLHCFCGTVIHFTDTEGKEVCPRCGHEHVLAMSVKTYLGRLYARQPGEFIETRSEQR